MIYITGDTHRDFSDIEEFCQYGATTKDDVLIILGDSGINFYGGRSDLKLKMELNELPITLLCIHGNHEMRPESIDTYEEIPYFGGIVYAESDFPNLLFAKDGEIYELNGNRCIAIGGAYSVDKPYRSNECWWEDEQPSKEIMERVEEKLNFVNWHIDIVLSHTCPFKYRPVEAFLPMTEIEESLIDKSTEKWLGSIEKRLKYYSEWYCGHFHTEKDIEKMRFLYKSILEFDEL